MKVSFLQTAKQPLNIIHTPSPHLLQNPNLYTQNLK